MSEPSRPDPNDLPAYVDWLNDEKFKERKAFIVLVTTIATSLLAFTASFRKDIIGTNAIGTGLLKAFWILLLLCVTSAVVYYLLEIRYMFYQRVRKINTHVPRTHYAGTLERWSLFCVAFVAPTTFVLALVFLTAFVITNTT